MLTAKTIAIGDEILIGQILDTNSNFLAKQLKDLGVILKSMTVCSDVYEDIYHQLEEAVGKYDFVFITGGLGPTKDDRTKNCIADFLGCELQQSEEVLEQVKRIIIPRNGMMNPQNYEQALVPQLAKPLSNRCGTAPILQFQKEVTTYFSMPGVPFEMKTAFTEQIRPLIQKQTGYTPLHTQDIMTFGLGESFLAERIEEWENNLPEGVSLAYLPSMERLRLRLTYNPDVLPVGITPVLDDLKQLIPELIYAYEDVSLAEVVSESIKKQGATLAVAESCTGGHIAQQLTVIPGASSFFKSSLVAYTEQAKIELLGIPSELIAKQGVVSEAVALEMAVKVRERMGADYGLSTTGFLGPTGGTDEAPVGTVWVAVATNDRMVTRRLFFSDVRERDVKRASVNALNLLRLSL